MAAGDTHRILVGQFSGDHSTTDIVRRLESATSTVASRIRVPPGCRVMLWADALRRLASANRRSVLEQMIPSLRQGRWDHPFRNSFTALVDSRMFIAIVENLLPLLRDHDLHDLLSGNYHASADGSSSRSRDREFELFIAAVCRRAGLLVALSEPDIQIEVDGKILSIAAKRLASPRRVEKNIRKASQQISVSGHPGFVFLDVSRLLDPTGSIVTHWRTASQTVGGHLLALTKSEQRASFTRPRHELVRGFVVRAAFPHVSQGFRYGTFEDWMAEVPLGISGAEVNRLLDHLGRGLDGS